MIFYNLSVVHCLFVHCLFFSFISETSRPFSGRGFGITNTVTVTRLTVAKQALDQMHAY